MRMPILLALLAAACARELRSTNPELWLELETEHFTLRTDLPEEDARRAISDLELIRNALLAAGWHGETASPAHIGVVAVASERELHEVLVDKVDGMASSDRFGQRMIFVSGGGNLLDSEEVKHEVTHALLSEYPVGWRRNRLSDGNPGYRPAQRSGRARQQHQAAALLVG